jgi:hypothetical protein
MYSSNGQDAIIKVIDFGTSIKIKNRISEKVGTVIFKPSHFKFALTYLKALLYRS